MLLATLKCKAPRPSGLGFELQCRKSSGKSTIQALQAAFRDPSSPFHIPPGTQGPSSPDAPPPPLHFSTSSSQAKLIPELSPESESELPPPDVAEEARRKLLALGYDPTSFWEQPIVWGEQDSFQHVNNVQYVRYFESGRIHWMRSLANEIGGPDRAEAMLRGKGTSLILKSIEVKYRRPVTYPDTLLIAHRPHMPSGSGSHSRTQFSNAAVAYSYKHRAIVTESDSVLVWYDYDHLRKIDPGDRVWEILKGRMRS